MFKKKPRDENNNKNMYCSVTMQNLMHLKKNNTSNVGHDLFSMNIVLNKHAVFVYRLI